MAAMKPRRCALPWLWAGSLVAACAAPDNSSRRIQEERRRLEEGTVRNAGLSHWTLHGHGGHPEGGGSSWYTRAFDLLDTGYALRGFQIGLGGAWLLPDAPFDTDQCPCAAPGVTSWCYDGTCDARGGCADVWETMEGGLGYWRNELPSPRVKWRLNNVNGCYAQETMSTLWDFYGVPIKCEDMGFVIVTNRLVVAPDGLGFEGGPDYGMLGQAFMRTTLGRAGAASGLDDWTYLLVLDAANFKGPVGYTVEEFWRDHKGYEAAPDFSSNKVKIGSTGFEFNGVEAYTSSQGEETFLKIPKLQFPVDGGKTTILAGVRGWGLSTLQEPLERALNGESLPGTLLKLDLGQQSFCNEGQFSSLRLGFDGFPMILLGGSMRTNEYSGDCVSELVWDNDSAVCEGGLPSSIGVCTVPEIWEFKEAEEVQVEIDDWSSVDCVMRCKAAGYCCNDDVAVSGNQFLSCLQACDIRKRGTDENACQAHCSEVAENRGCQRTINGQDYGLCGACSDLRPDDKCTYGVGGIDACQFGCSLRERKPERLEPTAAHALPAWSQLDSRHFPEKTFDDVPELKGVKDTSAHGSCLTSPGPARETLYCVWTSTGSVVGFQWFRFVDQPALQRNGLSSSQKEYLQQRVERLHEQLEAQAPLNAWMEAPPEASRLATLDSNLLVLPPFGLQRGYVPVPVYEGASADGCTFNAGYDMRERTFVTWEACAQDGQEGNCGPQGTSLPDCRAKAEQACDEDDTCVAYAILVEPSSYTYLLYPDRGCVQEHAYSDHRWHLFVKKEEENTTQTTTLTEAEAGTTQTTTLTEAEAGSTTHTTTRTAADVNSGRGATAIAARGRATAAVLFGAAVAALA